MEVLIRFAAVALLFVGSACEFVPAPTMIDPPQDALLVHSVLSAGSDTVRVLLTRPASEQSFDAAPVPVSGAQVRIAGGGAEVLLREAPEGFGRCLAPRPTGNPSPPPPVAGPGCYAAILPGGVQSGIEYVLEVDVPGGERATGETRVPAAPEWILSPGDERIILRWSGGTGIAESVVLRWRSAAAAVEIPTVVTDEVYIDGSRVAGANCVLYLTDPDGNLAGYVGTIAPSDSVRARAQLANCTQRGATPDMSAPLRPDSAAVSLLIAAYDSAYAAHAESSRQGGRGIREDRASPGLEGAYGVFGSVATSRRRVLFLFEDS